MERAELARRFQAAAAAARDFARSFLEEPLPDDMRFRVRLNSSCDDSLRADEVTFPEEGGLEQVERDAELDADAALDLLWRDGRVPEWIDVRAVDETGAATILELEVCGRFTSNEALLHHARGGRPPFHILSPALPHPHRPGKRFSIHRRKECWSRAALER